MKHDDRSELGFLFFFRFQICCRWVWLLPVLGYGVSGDGFRCCWWFEVDGVWLILSLIFAFVRWVSTDFGVGFGSISVGGLAHGGLRGGSRWWFPVLVDSGGLRCGFVLFFCFMLLQTHNVKYLLDHFPKCKQTLEKQSFFLKSFAFANILR